MTKNEHRLANALRMVIGLMALALVLTVPLVIWHAIPERYEGKTVKEWVSDLSGEKDRLRALAALQQFGPKAKAAIPQVISILKAEDMDNRIQNKMAAAIEWARKRSAASSFKDYSVFGREGSFTWDAETKARWRSDWDERVVGEKNAAEKLANDSEAQAAETTADEILQERISAAQTLEKIGPTAKAVAPSLRVAAAPGEPEQLPKAAAAALVALPVDDSGETDSHFWTPGIVAIMEVGLLVLAVAAFAWLKCNQGKREYQQWILKKQSDMANYNPFANEAGDSTS